MMYNSGNVAGLFHARPSWMADPASPASEQLRALIVERRMARWRDEACLARVLRHVRRTRSLRYRIGHAISGFGRRIAGDTAARPI